MAAVVALAVPSMAQATLVYVKNPSHPAVWAAADDGSGAHRLVAGSNPRVSPDGRVVALLHQGKGRKAQPELVLAPADGSAPASTLATGWREPSVFNWSPDSKSVVAVLGPELGPKRLVLIDTVTGAQRTVAQGYFSGVSFSPEPSLPPGHGRRMPPRLVYARSGSERYPPRSDIFTASLAGGKPVQITKGGNSLDPLWGPNGKIVFVKLLGAKHRRYGPKNELYLMDPGGENVRRLTHTHVGPLLQGLSPTAWSADGTRLLAEFGGQDTSYAVTVDPQTGAQRPVAKAAERGLVGTALSADGSTILGATGGFEPGPGHDAVSIPYGGGGTTVLARNAFEPDWSR